MKRMNWGPWLVAMIAALNVGVWFWVRQGTEKFTDYSVSTHSLGQLSGLVGLTLFSLTFILTTRARWVERLFGGLDKVYKAHHFIGALSFALLLFHPILLVLKFVPSDVGQAAIYLLPSASWAVNFGIIALLSMIVLIVLTLYITMKYQNWKLSHALMGIVYIIALLHIFTVTTDISRYPVLFWFMACVSAIGLAGFAYGTFIRRFFLRKPTYVVDAMGRRGSLSVIDLVPEHGRIQYMPGQFAFISVLDKTIGHEQHPFTIASSPLNPRLRFVIKDLGDYTTRIGAIKQGSRIKVEGPYGHFTGAGGESIWIAGGIGITPFLAMAEHLALSPAASGRTTPIHLYYCTKTKAEAAMLDELQRYAAINPSLRVLQWCSDERGYLSADDVDKMSGLGGKHIYICGPPPMMRSLVEQLRKKGVRRSHIHLEDFDFK